MKGIGYIASFLIGGACGSAGMWFGIKKYYENKAENEVYEARRAFHRILKERKTTNEEKGEISNPDVENKNEKQEIVVEDEPDKKTYSSLLSSLGYSPTEDDTNQEPELIGENMFGKNGHSKVYLTWYEQDNVLVNTENGEIYDELEDLIGEEGSEMLCDSDVEAFFMSNSALGIDIKITIDRETLYNDVYDS